MQNESDTEYGDFESRLLWGASSVLTLGIISKFAASFRRSHQQDKGDETKTNTNIAPLLNSARQKIHSAENIISVRDEEVNPLQETMLLLLRQQIYDYLHEIHQELLEREVEQIINVIPLLDKLIRFWHPDRAHNSNEAEIEHYHILLLNFEQKMKQNKLLK